MIMRIVGNRYFYRLIGEGGGFTLKNRTQKIHIIPDLTLLCQQQIFVLKTLILT